MSRTREIRDEVIRDTQEAAAFNQWLSNEIQEALDDPRPSVPQDEVLAGMQARIARSRSKVNMPLQLHKQEG